MNTAGITLSLPALFLLGLAASPHCALMCAPMAASVRKPQELLSLHAGRLAAYALLGAVAGAFGTLLLHRAETAGWLMPLRWLGAVLMIALGLWQLRTPRPRPACCVRAPRAQTQALLLRGVLWGLMPCTLLYSALGLAALSASATQGALLLLAFGLGASPLLLLIGGAVTRALRQASAPTLRRSAAAGLVIAGLWLAATTPQAGAWLSGWCLS